MLQANVSEHRNDFVASGIDVFPLRRSAATHIPQRSPAWKLSTLSLQSSIIFGAEPNLERVEV
jgi:hypothetical protein